MTIEEPKGELIEAAGTAVHLQRAGDGHGPVAVLIHGGGPGASSWSNYKLNVPTLGRERSLLLLDLPGYGRSGPAAGDEGESMFMYYARAVRDVLDHLDIEQVDFVGNSLGGSTSFRFAMDYSERARRLVLMGPGGVAMPAFSPGAKMAAALGGVANKLISDPTPENMREFIRTMVFDEKLITDETVAERLEAQLRLKAERAPLLETWQKAGGGHIAFDRRDFDIWTLCEVVKHPTLLIWGRDDQINPVDGALYPLERMPNAELHVFGQCGHWAQVEHATVFDLVVTEFLDRTLEPAAATAGATA